MIIRMIITILPRVSNATVSVANVENAHHSTRWVASINSYLYLYPIYRNEGVVPTKRGGTLKIRNSFYICI